MEEIVVGLESFMIAHFEGADYMPSTDLLGKIAAVCSYPDLVFQSHEFPLARILSFLGGTSRGSHGFTGIVRFSLVFYSPSRCFSPPRRFAPATALRSQVGSSRLDISPFTQVLDAACKAAPPQSKSNKQDQEEMK